METQNLVLTAPEAGRLLGLSRGSAYAAVRNGSIPSLASVRAGSFRGRAHATPGPGRESNVGHDAKR